MIFSREHKQAPTGNARRTQAAGPSLPPMEKRREGQNYSRRREGRLSRVPIVAKK